MNKFSIVKNNILSSVVTSLLPEKEKLDILSYLFWNLGWDFDIDKYSISSSYIPSVKDIERRIK